MKRIQILGALSLAFAGLSGQSHAALLGAVQTFPDTTATTNPYLIYDFNAVNATTGRLLLVSGSSTLAEGPAQGGSSTSAQSYFGSGDSIPDILLTIDVRNGTGGLIAGSFVAGTVNIGFGNSTTANRWSWTGNITQIGTQAGTGTILDAYWTVTADSYQNMPSNMSQFVNGYLTGASGGIKINSGAAWGTTANFGNDWVFGPNPSANTNLNSFRAGMTNPIQTNSTIAADIFTSPVPEPEAALMLLAGLAVIAPMARRRKAQPPALPNQI